MLLFKVGLLTLINIDSFISLAILCPSLLLFGSYCDWWSGQFGCCVDECVRIPSGVACIFHHRSWRFPLGIHDHNLGHHIGINIWHHFG